MATNFCDVPAINSAVGRMLHDRGSGAHYRGNDALAAALGEALERYSGCFVPESELLLATACELGAQAVKPERFALFSEDQYGTENFPFEPFTSDTRVRWTRGWAIPDGEEVYLPQQLVYLDITHAEGEVVVCWPSSSGMALGLTEEDAVLGGLLELIERDAVMLTWYSRLSLPRLDWSKDDELAERERRHFAPSGLEYQVLDLSAFCDVPVAFAVLRSGNEDSVAVFVSADAAPTMEAAWDRALRQGFQLRPWAKGLRRKSPDRSFRSNFSDIKTFDDHVLFYSTPEHEPHIAFLDGSTETRDIRDVLSLEGEGPAEWIEAIARRLEARGISAYAVDVTTPDLREADLHVVKVISPELQQLDSSYRLRCLGGRRLYYAAYDVGLRDNPLSAEELNPYPHPFP